MSTRTVSVAVLGAALLSALACANGTPCADGTTAAKDEACPSGGDTQPSDEAPEVLSFATNVTTLTVGESVAFTAVVTDPQGVADLIGGTLLTEGGGATYGSFVVGSDGGSYTITLSWDELHAVEPIEFESAEARIFVARFYDQAGNETEAQAEVRLQCPSSRESACDGVCLDTTADPDNCGTCGNRCPDFGGADPVCDVGVCMARTTCQDDLTLTCEQACIADGYSACRVYNDFAGTALSYERGDDCDGSGTVDYAGPIETCDEVMQVSDTAEFAYCYCAV